MVVHIIANPFSGKKDGKSLDEQLVRGLKASNFETLVHFTEYPGHEWKFAETLSLASDDILAVIGGEAPLTMYIMDSKSVLIN